MNTKEGNTKEGDKNKMIEEVKHLVGHPDLLHFLFQTFEVVIGLGSCHFKKPCFNEEFNDKMESALRTNGISFEITIDEYAIMRATSCYHLHGCPQCRAVCCLKKLSALPEGQNGLLDERLCEEVCRCVEDGAGIFGLSLFFALLRTSPDFGKDSLILFALTNSIKEDTRRAAAEIANIFFDAARKLNLEFLFFEPHISANRRKIRYAELDKMELGRCQTVYANEIDRIQKEKEVASVIDAVIEAALLEAEKKKMPKCHICKGDQIDNPPIYGPKTCRHKIFCNDCVSMVVDLNEKLNYTCPLCLKPFTDDDVWYLLRDPVVSDTD
jgi:hypothetical protein